MNSKMYSVYEVFTPSSPATNSFVERSHKVNNRLVSALRTPGKQIVLYGHSGCGKTSLIINKLDQIYENSITTNCMKDLSFEELIIDAFQQLDKYYTESATKKDISFNPELSVTYNDIKTSIKLLEIKDKTTNSQKAFLPPQLTPQSLARFFGESKICWIIEDFHKVKGAEKTRISQIMKIFMDLSRTYPEIKLVAIGAVGTARQVVQYDSEMINRIAEIEVPLMLTEEIEEIIHTGERFLNLRFQTALREKIIKYSCGLPSICHQICLNMCICKGIEQTQDETGYFNTKNVEDAIEMLIEERSDSLKDRYDKAIRKGNKTKINLPKEIIRAAINISKEEFSFDEIYKGGLASHEDSEVWEMMNSLCGVGKGEMLIYDNNSNLFRFSNLFLKSFAMFRLRNEESDAKSSVSTKDHRVIEKLLNIIQQQIEEYSSTDNLSVYEEIID